MSCVVPRCQSGKGGKKVPPGVTKHIFPKDPQKLEMWIRAIPREEWTPTKYSVVCSLHFEDSDFKSERQVRRYIVSEQGFPSKSGGGNIQPAGHIRPAEDIFVCVFRPKFGTNKGPIWLAENSCPPRN